MRALITALIAAVLFAISMPAQAQYTQGGVIPGSADDYSFRHGQWVPNRHPMHFREGRGSGMREFSRGGHDVQVYRWRRLVGVRRVYAQPTQAPCGGNCGVKARPTCGSRCTVKRPTCGTRCKPKCSTCGSVAGSRQTNTAKVSGMKSVVKGNGNAVNQTVTINQTNVFGGGARSSAASPGTSDCSIAEVGMKMLPKPPNAIGRGRNPKTGNCAWIYR